MSLYDKLRPHLRAEEGLVLKTYLCPGGYATIGIGRNLEAIGLREGEAQYICDGVVPDDIWDYRLDESGAWALLDNDIADFKGQVDNRWPWAKDMHLASYTALMSMVFQMGLEGVSGFKNMLSSLEAHGYEAAAAHALDSKWAQVDTPARAQRVAAMIRSSLVS